jgi:polysaccharide biosynthesis transport protein
MENQPQHADQRLAAVRAEALPPPTRPRNGYPSSRAPYADYTYYGSDSHDEPETGGQLEYWGILRRRKGTLILIAFGCALIGFLVTLPQTPIYQAHTLVELVGLNDNFLNIKQVNPVTETGATLETSDIQTQIRILQSESLVERVVDKLKMAKAPDSQDQSRLSMWRRALNMAEPVSANPREDVVKRISRGLKVRSAGQTRLLEITADSPDPRTATDIANTLASEFIEQNLEARWKTTEHTSQWLTRQLDEMRIKLERSEDSLQAYARQSGLMFTMEKTSVSEEKLSQIQQTVSALQADRVSKQSRYEMALASPPEALPDVLNDASLREYQAKLTELRRQIAELTATYTPEHTKVRRVQAQLATIEAALQRERADIIRRIGNEYEEAKRKEALMTGAYSGQAQQVVGESEKAIKYNILKREVDSNRSLYDTMLGQLKQATIAAAMRASNVRIVDPAKVPSRPYKPDAALNSGLGLLAGIFLGAAFVIMRERADRTIQQPGDAPFYLNLPELGIIPAGATESARQLERLERMMSNGNDRLLPLSEGRENGNHPARGPAADQGTQTAVADRIELITWQHKPSVVAESFRSLLISILFSDGNGSRPKVLVLTSASPSEGKSTVVSNLGIAIAEVGQKVLLIDADLRKPRLQHIFSLTNERGLSDILRKRTTMNGNGNMGGLIRETEVPGLFVLTSGPETAGSTSLLYGAYLPELLKQLGAEFETILIDTPPMLQIPDARVVGRIADGVIVVLRSGKTSRDAAMAATQRFAEDGTKILGTILNDWNPKSSPDGYYGYHSSEYTTG